MERVKRLQLVSRLSYYIAWIAAAAAVIGHITRFNLRLADITGISGRNLLEASLLLFIACVASEARVISLARDVGVPHKETAPQPKAQAKSA